MHFHRNGGIPPPAYSGNVGFLRLKMDCRPDYLQAYCFGRLYLSKEWYLGVQSY